MSLSAARQPPGSSVYTWGDPSTPTPLALSSCLASLDYISRGAPGPTGAGSTALGRGRHVPPLSANAEPFGEVTCRCLALLCALGSVGAQCGQAARTGQVGVGFLEEPAGSKGDGMDEMGCVFGSAPCWKTAGGAAGP